MPADIPVTDGWPPSARTRIRRLPDRASYERADIYAVVDATITCTVGYVIDGRPYVTPTAHWRDGDRIYWHGSAASRFLKSVVGQEACVSVHLIDGLVLARSGFEHSMNYRSATLFGRVEAIPDADKGAALDAFIEKLVPGRSGELRAPTEAELKQTTVLAMTVVEASAKVRAKGVADKPEDFEASVWAGILAVETRLSELVPDAEFPLRAAPSAELRELIGKRL
jgi:nitroimidazol reductase NimA-like FMN-containing flavoprotein (pyridoxamine 5'-phosphate oxidase superfamily)